MRVLIDDFEERDLDRGDTALGHHRREDVLKQKLVPARLQDIERCESAGNAKALVLHVIAGRRHGPHIDAVNGLFEFLSEG